MTEYPGQLRLDFAEVDGETAPLDFEALAADSYAAYKVGSDAAAIVALSDACATLDSSRFACCDLSPSERWRRYVTGPPRALPPRTKINDLARADLFASSGYRCVSCRRHCEDVSLNVGHVLSRDEAFILLHVAGDTRPVQLIDMREDWIPECAKCNLDHRSRSFDPAAALVLPRPVLVMGSARRDHARDPRLVRQSARVAAVSAVPAPGEDRGVSELARYGRRLDLDTLRDQFAPGASDLELEHFALVCRHLALDPYVDQICLIGRHRKIKVRDERSGRDVEAWRMVHRPQVTVAGRRAIASRTGRLRAIIGPEWCGPRRYGPAGEKLPLEWLEVWDDDDGYPYAARCFVLPAGWSSPVNGTCKWAEFAQYTDSEQTKLSPLWKRMPSHMLAKTAEALALRRGFPEVEAAVGYAEGRDGLEADDGAIIDEAEASRQQLSAQDRPGGPRNGRRLSSPIPATSTNTAGRPAAAASPVDTFTLDCLSDRLAGLPEPARADLRARWIELQIPPLRSEAFARADLARVEALIAELELGAESQMRHAPTHFETEEQTPAHVIDGAPEASGVDVEPAYRYDPADAEPFASSSPANLRPSKQGGAAMPNTDTQIVRRPTTTRAAVPNGSPTLRTCSTRRPMSGPGIAIRRPPRRGPIWRSFMTAG